MRLNGELVSTKSNVLIQNYSWHLKLYDLKVFELLCGCYNTQYYDPKKNIIKISLNDLAKELNDKSILEGGYYYKRFKDAIKRLSDTSIWVTINGNVEHLLRMVNTYDIIYNDSTITCYMSEDYKIHMEQHPKGNAFVEFKIVNGMTSKYSGYLYNLLRSWDGLDQVSFDIDYLKNELWCTTPTYNNITIFKKTLNNAIDEINSLTNLNVSYTTEKKGKKISTITFYISKNNDNIEKQKDNNIINQVNEQIEYERLKKDWLDNLYLEPIRNIIVEILKTTEKQITISSMDYDTENVVKIFKQINYDIIYSILIKINECECYNNGSYIKYLKEYLKSSLYFETLQYCEFERYKQLSNG